VFRHHRIDSPDGRIGLRFSGIWLFQRFRLISPDRQRSEFTIELQRPDRHQRFHRVFQWSNWQHR
jgi:hypothetical protein